MTNGKFIYSTGSSSSATIYVGGTGVTTPAPYIIGSGGGGGGAWVPETPKEPSFKEQVIRARKWAKIRRVIAVITYISPSPNPARSGVNVREIRILTPPGVDEVSIEYGDIFAGLSLEDQRGIIRVLKAETWVGANGKIRMTIPGGERSNVVPLEQLSDEQVEILRKLDVRCVEYVDEIHGGM
jgi:hypothetical protein